MRAQLETLQHTVYELRQCSNIRTGTKIALAEKAVAQAVVLVDELVTAHEQMEISLRRLEAKA